MGDLSKPTASHGETSRGSDRYLNPGETSHYGHSNGSTSGSSRKQMKGPDPKAQQLAQIIQEAKMGMQSKTANNGVTYALIGSSGCGKSTLIRKVFIDYLYDGPYAEKDYIITVYTLSKTSDALQHMSKDILVDGNGVDVDAINLDYKTNQEYGKKFNIVNILDDCIHIRHEKMVERMFLIMRNSNITSVVSLQYGKLIPPSIRTSVYFSFCMRQNSPEAIEVMVRGWVGGFLPGNNIHEKIQFYYQWTKEKGFFLLDNMNCRCWQVDGDYTCTELFIQNNISSSAAREEGVDGSDYIKSSSDDLGDEASLASVLDDGGGIKKELKVTECHRRHKSDAALSYPSSKSR